MRDRSRGLLFRYALQSLAIVIAGAAVIRIFLISSYVNSGHAMLPSVWPGEFLVGAKWGLESVERGDLVILRCPNSRDRICLKRVVGLPGDRIEIRNGVLEINGKRARYKPVAPEVKSEAIAGASWLIWQEPAKTVEQGTKTPVVVPPQRYYLLNDKRSEAEDSRIWGPVEHDLLEARALAIWLSLDWFEADEVRSWPRVRWSRLFRSIH